MNLQCKKRTGCANTVYNFEIGVKATPDMDSINIGDTIWFSIDAPDMLRDIQTNALINYSGVANLGSAIGIQKLNGSTFSVKAVSKFKFILLKGQNVQNSQDLELYKEYLFDDLNGMYQFKLGVSPTESGIYSFVFSNAANVYRKSDACTKAAFTINFTQTNQHYYLNPNFQGGSTPIGGDYYFKVK